MSNVMTAPIPVQAPTTKAPDGSIAVAGVAGGAQQQAGDRSADQQKKGLGGGVLASVTASVAFAALFGVPGMLSGLDSFATFGWRILAALPFLAIILTVMRAWPQMGRLFKRFRAKPALLLVLLADSLLWGFQVFLFAWGPMTGNALAVSMGYFLLPLVLVAIGVVLFREKLTWLGSTAVGLAAVGVVIALATGANISWATFAVAFGYPAYFILRRKFQLDSPAALSLEMLILVPLSIFFIAQSGQLAAAVEPSNLIGIAILGFFTAVGFAAYSVAQRGLPMSLFGVLGYLEPVLLVVVSVLLLGEPLGIADGVSYLAIGAAIIVMSVDGIRQGRPPKAARVARRQRRKRAVTHA